MGLECLLDPAGQLYVIVVCWGELKAVGAAVDEPDDHRDSLRFWFHVFDSFLIGHVFVLRFRIAPRTTGRAAVPGSSWIRAPAGRPLRAGDPRRRAGD